jgi:hypothetical protein
MKKKLTNEEMCKIAGDYARKQTLKDCKVVGLTTRKTLKAIAEGLAAKETKTSFDKDRARWAYSDPLIDHKTRLSAAALAISILDLKPPEKKEIQGTLTLNHELPAEVETMFEKIYSKGKK